MMKKLLSVLLALMLAMGCVGALAEGETAETPAETTEAAAETTETAEAPAETAETPAETAETAEAGDAEAAELVAALTEPVLLVTVNGEEIYDNNNDFSYMQYYFQYMFSMYGYDVSDPTVALYVNQLALVNSIQHALLLQKAKEKGYDQLGEEKMTALKEQAAATWEEIVTDQMASLGITDESSDDDRAAARVEALAVLEAEGYTEEIYLQDLIDSEMISRLQEDIYKDVQVTDEEVIAHFNALVEEDKASYEGNVSNYEFTTGYYGQESYYIPEGYRGITHILLAVDENLLNNWTDLTARLEEQKEAENAESTEPAEDGEAEDEEVVIDLGEVEVEGGEGEELVLDLAGADVDDEEAEELLLSLAETAEGEGTEGTDAEAAAEPTATPEPVTQEMVDAAKQAILDSVQATVEEIMAKYKAGTSFEELIAEYGTDNGMKDETTLKEGYKIHPESILYDPSFVAGAMSLEKIGDVSEPIVSKFGVHILQYLRDIPGGAVELSDTLKEELRSELLSEAQQDAFNDVVDQWMKEADIRYTEAGELWKMPEETAEEAEEEATEEAAEEAAEATAEEKAEEAPEAETPAEETADKGE